MATKKDFQLEEVVEPLEVPKRLAFIKKDSSAAVTQVSEDTVMAYPDLLLRILIGFELLLVVLAVISLLADAPLEELANPAHTPNPAKAPWYFLGLQELLHLFPPFVAGIMIPAMVVVALIVIPYFDINIKRDGLWKQNPQATLARVSGVALVLIVAMVAVDAFAIAVPTLLIYGLMLLTYVSKKETGFIGWLANKSLAEWIMSWFVLVAVVLTLIGILFRGPGWEWNWPWNGIY